MSFPSAPFGPRTGLRGMVNAADQLASIAGVGALEQGGSAADAAVAAAAVMAVTSPHLCGMGGDLLAMVASPGFRPAALLAVGRAGSGADPARMRADGHSVMPLRGDVRSVTVPGAVDGWLALHDRFGRLPLGTVLGPGHRAGRGRVRGLHPPGPVEPSGVRGARGRRALPRRAAPTRDRGPAPGHRPHPARPSPTQGRDGLYRGEFGRALRRAGGGRLHRRPTSTAPLADWCEPVRLARLGS